MQAAPLQHKKCPVSIQGRPRLMHLAILALSPGAEPVTRRRIYGLVQEHPGLHQRDIARRLDLRPSHAEYHLYQLTKTGLLRAETGRGYKRYFPAAQTRADLPEIAVLPADRPWLALLREPRPLELVAHLLQESPLAINEIARRMDLAVSTVGYHIKKLEEQAIVKRHRVGNQRYVAIEDRDRLVRVLLAHEPPDDLVEGFEELWDDIGL